MDYFYRPSQKRELVFYAMIVVAELVDPQLDRAVTPLRRCGARRVRRLIAELPEEFRELIVLRDIIQLSYRDIAKVLGVSTDTLLSRLAAARSEVRARLKIGEQAAP